MIYLSENTIRNILTNAANIPSGFLKPYMLQEMLMIHGEIEEYHHKPIAPIEAAHRNSPIIIISSLLRNFPDSVSIRPYFERTPRLLGDIGDIFFVSLARSSIINTLGISVNPILIHKKKK